jgi:hypothetical protein
MADEKKDEGTILGKEHSYLAKLIQLGASVTVVVPQDVLDQGSTAQFPVEDVQPEPNPEDQNVDKGTSDSNPNPEKQNHQAPSASG